MRQPQQVVAAGPCRVQRAGIQQCPDMQERPPELPVRLTVDQRGALVGRIQAQYHPHRGRLAGTVGADEPGDLPGPHCERHTVERDGRAEPLAQGRDLDGIVHVRNVGLGAAGVVTPRSHLRRPSHGGPVSLTPVTPGRTPAATMASVGTATSARLPAIAGAALGLAAVVESLVRLAGTDATIAYGLVLCLLAAATTLPAFVRNPLVAAVSVTGAAVLSLSAFKTLTVAGAIAQVFIAYRVGRSGPPAVALVLGLPYVVLALIDGADSFLRVLTVLLAVLAPVAAGAGIAARVRWEEQHGRAAEHAVADAVLEHTARGERARIARELHDVVAHHISMIAVQSETARLTTPGMPAAGAQRLSAIGDTARAALTEMRRLLGVLREDAELDVADRQPQPGLQHLTELLDEARDATGAGTRLILRGPPVPLSPGVELAAYRIVQEALTNSRRHAPGAAVDVELHYTASRAATADPRQRARSGSTRGDGSGQTSPGHGLLGMRERAAAVGGELRAGAAATGGFLVEATLPTGTEDIA